MSPSAGGAQQRVGHGVQQHVGVAVADQRAGRGNVDAAQPQRSAGREPMRVVSDSDACAQAWLDLLILVGGNYLQ